MILSACFAKLYHVLPVVTNPLQQLPPESLRALACPLEMWDNHAFLLSVYLDAVISGSQNSVDCLFR